jgi:hypothetical protein
MEDINPGQLARMRNLKMFKGKTDEQILEYLKNRKPKPPKPPRIPKVDKDILSDSERSYLERFNKKLSQLRDEYSVDMNEANDAEGVRSLVRLVIQAEDANEKIRALQHEVHPDDKQLKNYGDFQRGLITSITDLQDKLGITRKVRKERQVDDIPQYLKEIRLKARDFWDRKTFSVRCEKCEIELARYWLNFPNLASKADFELECWRCNEKVVYVR